MMKLFPDFIMESVSAACLSARFASQIGTVMDF